MAADEVQYGAQHRIMMEPTNTPPQKGGIRPTPEAYRTVILIILIHLHPVRSAFAVHHGGCDGHEDYEAVPSTFQPSAQRWRNTGTHHGIYHKMKKLPLE